ncbi:MAG: integrase core domain-containing protein [Candidatus Hodarchaeales archaeon]
MAIDAEPLQSPRISVGTILDMLFEVKVFVERWRREYNHIRPHSSLGHRPPTELVQSMGAG